MVKKLLYGSKPSYLLFQMAQTRLRYVIDQQHIKKERPSSSAGMQMKTFRKHPLSHHKDL
eukprot:2150626-Ditylum_brightwellii.AAC.1